MSEEIPQFPYEGTKEDRQEWVDQASKRADKRSYEEACEFAGHENPTAWENLTAEQQENIHEERIRFQQEMNDFGEAIRAGNIS